MDYKIINLDTCHSTQDELKNQIISGEKLAIRSFNQTKGRGRRGDKWVHFENSLAISFSIKPLEVLTLTPLFIGICVCEYFRENYKIRLGLKWPNDILNMDDEKVGGIICDVHDKKTVLVGLGLNLFRNEKSDQDFDYNYILDDQNFDLEHFLSFIDQAARKKIHKRWENHCVHMNKIVRFSDEGREIITSFLGIGEMGEALFKTSPPRFSGSIIL